LLTQGESAACVYFLLSGLVKLSRAGAGGDAAVLLVEGVGRPLLLAESLSGKPWPADAQAVTPVRLMCFDAAVLREAMKQERAFALSVLAAASLDLHQLISQVEELKAMTGPGRIAALILNLVDEREGAARVKLPYAKQLVAARLGMTPESFSRAMRRLAAQGVKPRGDELIVADLEKIVAFVENGGRDESAR
jgi:CRP-like cAMP-binding protein